MSKVPELAQYDRCSGCGACFAACRHDAISMRHDSEGFIRPVVDESKCTGCLLCKKACPVLSPYPPNEECDVYAAISKDYDIRKASTSGGVFSLLAIQILNQGGVVYGVAFEVESGDIVFRRVVSLQELPMLRGSKYVQADAGRVLCEVKRDLEDAKVPVLFSGTPCQIAGLKKYLQSAKVDIGNLHLVEVVCHAVSSPLAWDRYLRQLKCTVASVNFRSKRRGWNRYTMSVVDAQGRERSSHFRGYTYLWGFLQSLFNRRSCHECSFRHGRSGADLTIGDFWGVERAAKDLDDGGGVSVVIIRSQQGGRLWDGAKDKAIYRESDMQTVVECNPALRHSPTPHPRRNDFFLMMSAGCAFDKAVKKLLRMSLAQRIMHPLINRIVKRNRGVV